MRRLLALTALLLPLTVACGTGADPSVALRAIDVVRAAGDKTVEAGSARLEMSMEAEGMQMSARGITSLSETRGTLTMTMRMKGQAFDMEMRMLGDVAYMKVPQLSQQSPKPWMRIDMKKAAKTNDAFAMSQMQQNDPAQALSYFQGVADDVREVGKEDVRGEPTTKYTATIDLTKATERQQKPRVREALESFMKQVGTTTMPITVWIDDDGLMRKATYTLDLTNASKGEVRGPMTTTIEMYDFGVPVKVSAPPASQVTDVTRLAG